MKKIIVIDWLDKYSGSERVITYLDQIFKFDKMYTLINQMSEEDLNKLKNGRSIKVEDTVLRFSKSKFRWFYFLFFYLIKTIKIDQDVDLIISSSHSIAKGVKKTNKNQLHISYFQNKNNNYIWDEIDLYFGKTKYFLLPIIYLLRKLDILQAQKPDVIICNSVFTKNWVKEKYNRDSFVIYPPIDFTPFDFTPIKEEYYITIGRLAKIKKLDLVVKAFNINKKKLIIVGDGEELQYLKSISNNNIVFTGFLTSNEINNYLKHARGYIQMGIESFGIAPLEAQYCGTPVIAFKNGAILETVIEDKTGVFFENQSIEDLNNAINRFEKIKFDYDFINNHSKSFSIDNFKEKVTEIYNRSIEKET